MQSKYDEARDSLQQQARDKSERLGNRMDAAQCLQNLSNIQHMEKDDKARDEFEQLGRGP
jgi:hypothetical protein